MGNYFSNEGLAGKLKNNFEKILNPVLFAMICIIWGSSFILMKLGMFDQHDRSVLSAYQVASIRVLSAGLVLLPFIIKIYERFNFQTWTYIIASGLLGIFFPAYLFCVAETRLDSNLAGILNALTPFFTILSGLLFFGRSVEARQIVGIVLGFSGILLLFITHRNIRFHDLPYSLLIVLATICYGLNSNLVTNKLPAIPAMTIACMSFVTLIIPSFIILYLTGYFSLPINSGIFLSSTLASCALGILGSALAWILFYKLVKRSSPVFASSVTFVIPAIALGWGWFYGESIFISQIFFLLIILAGVFLASPIGKRVLKGRNYG
jgi:drug/metabolite transporter (DMT)-like permease